MGSVEQDSKQPSAKEQYWRDLIQRWHVSGLTVRVFCTEHHLSEPSFYSWRRTITLRDQPQQAGDACTQSTLGDEPADLPAFVPVRVVPSAVDATSPSTVAGLELVIGSRRVVRVPPSFDADTLRRLLTILEETPSC
jgi:transposase